MTAGPPIPGLLSRPADPALLARHVERLRRARRFGPALRWVRRLAIVVPARHDVLRAEVAFLLALRRGPAAARAARRGLVLFPASWMLAQDHGNAFALHQRYGVAETWLRRAVCLAPGRRALGLRHISILMLLKRYAEAEGRCRDLIARGQDGPGTRFWLGRALWSLGRQGEADAELNRAAAAPGLAKDVEILRLSVTAADFAALAPGGSDGRGQPN